MPLGSSNRETLLYGREGSSGYHLGPWEVWLLFGGTRTWDRYRPQTIDGYPRWKRLSSSAPASAVLPLGVGVSRDNRPRSASLQLALKKVAMLGCLISRASVHKMLDVCRHPRLQPLSLHSLHSPLNSHMTLAGWSLDALLYSRPKPIFTSYYLWQHCTNSFIAGFSVKTSEFKLFNWLDSSRQALVLQ